MVCFFSHLGFWSGSLFLIAPFPDLCLHVLFFPTAGPHHTCTVGSRMANELNPRKCTVIRVHTGRKAKFQSNYRLLEVVHGNKYLGVTVTNNIAWSKHVLAIAGKSHHSLGFLRRNFKHYFRQVKVATNSTVVRPVKVQIAPCGIPTAKLITRP